MVSFALITMLPYWQGGYGLYQKKFYESNQPRQLTNQSTPTSKLTRTSTGTLLGLALKVRMGGREEPVSMLAGTAGLSMSGTKLKYCRFY